MKFLTSYFSAFSITEQQQEIPATPLWRALLLGRRWGRSSLLGTLRGRWSLRWGNGEDVPTIPLLSRAGKSFSLTGVSGNLVLVPTWITLQTWGLILLGKPEVSSWWALLCSLSPASSPSSGKLFHWLSISWLVLGSWSPEELDDEMPGSIAVHSRMLVPLWKSAL